MRRSTTSGAMWTCMSKLPRTSSRARADGSGCGALTGAIVVCARPAMPERTFVARPAAADVPSWVRKHYELVDAAAVDEYVLDFDPDVELRFASEPPVQGRAAVRDAL